MWLRAKPKSASFTSPLQLYNTFAPKTKIIKFERRPKKNDKGRKEVEGRREEGGGRVFTFKISVNNIIRMKVLESECKLICNALYLWESEKMSV